MVIAVVAAWAMVHRARLPAPSPEPLHTRHLAPDGSPLHTNRLAREHSPYLRQHAHNPVDWYPWGDEAFAKARAERKPILLSVGYSTCHWCHVMAEESFEDDEIAAYLNAHYVAIKVDREERPDVDAVYMNAVQLLTHGGGGWPMTVWLTADRQPFYAGTYFPPRAGGRGQQHGFLELLTTLAEAQAADPTQVAAAAATLTERLDAAAATTSDEALPGVESMTHAYAETAPSFDAQHGGFGTRPKFPRPAQLLFLLRQHRRIGDPAPLDMVVRTLDAMATGGVHDQLGGGFHRYAVDPAWRVPHFEKMLYDNALLAITYLEAAQASGRADFAQVARTTLAYLARDMAAPRGGFFAASDADSDGQEGAYFLWTADEIAAVLGPERAPLVTAWFDVGGEPTTLATPATLAQVAATAGMTTDAARTEIDAARAALLAARGGRVPPHVDRKVIVGWNGLAIAAFARASRVLNDAALAETARHAAAVLLDTRKTDGRLPRYLLDGEAHGQGYLDDYAFLEAGLLDLFEATADVRWLREALALQAVQDEHFADPRGGYFLTADDQEALLTREKPDYDGAEPAGNSVAALNMLRLAELTTDDRHRVRADALFQAFAPILSRNPSALPYLLTALDFRLDRVKEIVLMSPGDATAIQPFLARMAQTFVPSHVLVVVTNGAPSAELARLAPVAADKTVIDGKATAYVCEHGTCKLPTTDAATFAGQLTAQREAPARAPAGR